MTEANSPSWPLASKAMNQPSQISLGEHSVGKTSFYFRAIPFPNSINYIKQQNNLVLSPDL